jgi:beta-lactam-binding protein with PASTA domain
MDDGDLGVVLEQTPAAGVSVAPGLRVRLVVGDG